MESNTVNERLRGVIRKWIPEKGWGIINSYKTDGDPAPLKFFLHINNVSGGTPGVDLRVTFEVGPPRRLTELPVALNAEIVSTLKGGVK